jgi:hypothetical protein
MLHGEERQKFGKSLAAFVEDQAHYDIDIHRFDGAIWNAVVALAQAGIDQHNLMDEKGHDEIMAKVTPILHDLVRVVASTGYVEGVNLSINMLNHLKRAVEE